MIAFDVLDKDERPGAEDVSLRELRIFGELRGAVDAVPRRGKVRRHCRLRPLQVKDDGQRIGRVDAGDRGVIGLAHREDALRRVDDALVARLDIGRGQPRSVVKENIGPQLEGVGEPIRRHAPRLGQVADDLRIIGRVEFEQG